MDPRIQAVKNELSRQQIDKTVKEIRNNIARREREAFGRGILWSFVVMILTFSGVFAYGHTPNFGSLLGLFLAGLYYRYTKGN